MLCIKYKFLWNLFIALLLNKNAPVIMASEINVEAVCQFISSHGGKVKNTTLVSHFKKYLNNPETRGMSMILTSVDDWLHSECKVDFDKAVDDRENVVSEIKTSKDDAFNNIKFGDISVSIASWFQCLQHLSFCRWVAFKLLV